MHPAVLAPLLALPLTAAAQHVIETPLIWQDASAACVAVYGTRLYPAPTGGDSGGPWLALLANLSEPLYWIQRRGATTCTVVATEDGQLGEYSCDGDLFPALCT